MNRLYRSLWNASLGAWVAVPETARSAGKKTGSHVRCSGVAGATLLFGVLMASPAQAVIVSTGDIDNGIAPTITSTSWILDGLRVGNTTTGTVTMGLGDEIRVVNGVAQTVIGAGSNATGLLTMNGGNFSSNTLYVGQVGQGTLQVNAGAVVLERIWVGDPAGAAAAGRTGTVNLTSLSSSMTVAQAIAVGNNQGGSGALNVSAGAKLIANSELSYGNSSGSYGTGEFTGVDTQVDVAGDLNVGNAGTGDLTVRNQAVVNANGSTRVGNTGTGDGVLNIFDGAVLTSNDLFSVGGGTDSTGEVNVRGVGTQLVTNNRGDVFHLGLSGRGELNVDDRALVDSKSFVRIGSALGGVGVAEIKGESQWDITRDLTVGAIGQGTLNIIGANTQVTVLGQTFIGYDDRANVSNKDQSDGTLLVDAGTFNAGSILTLGNYADARAHVDNAGHITAGALRIGNTVNGTGAVTLDNNSRLDVTAGTTFVANSGQGTLTVNNGSQLTGVGAVVGNHAQGDASFNAGTSWALSSDLIVGYAARGTLTITNASLSSATGVLGHDATGNGLVTLEGAGASWSIASNQLTLGLAGVGRLNLRDHDFDLGRVTLGEDVAGEGVLDLDDNSVTLGQLLRGAGAGQFIVDGGTLRSSVSQSEFVSTGILGQVGANGFTLDNQGFDIGFNASLSGSGDVLIRGGGDVTLGGNGSSYTGSTLLDSGLITAAVSNALGSGGAVQVGGSQSAVLYLNSSAVGLTNNVHVQSGSTLAGFGSITGNTTLAAGARIQPGLYSRDGQQQAAISQGQHLGTLTINGDLSFANGAVYEVHTNPANSGSSDFIQVNGLASLAGGSVRHTGDAASFNLNERYHILNATGGLQGQFTTLDSDFAYLNVALEQLNNDVYLSIARNVDPGSPNNPNYSDYAQTPNQKEVGQALETMDPNNPLLNDVDRVTKGQASGMLNSLTGEVHAQVLGGLGNVASAVGAAGFDNLRTNLADSRTQCEAQAKERQRHELFDLASDCSSARPFWVETQGTWGRVKSDGNAAQRKQDSEGLYVGMDEAVGDDGWRLGGAFGYTHSKVRVDNNSSNSNIDSYSAALYGGKSFAHHDNRWNVLGGASYTHHRVAADRLVPLLVQTEKLKTDYNAHTAQVFGELSYTFDNASYHLEPFAGLNVSRVKSDSFKEKGGTAALRGNAQSQTRTSSTVGVRSYTTLNIAGADTRLSGTLGWKHAFDNRENSREMQFVSGSKLFSIEGVAQAKDTAIVDLQAEFGVARNATLSVGYSGEFASKVKENSAALTLRWDF